MEAEGLDPNLEDKNVVYRKERIPDVSMWDADLDFATDLPTHRISGPVTSSRRLKHRPFVGAPT
jgi:hypothetical protein